MFIIILNVINYFYCIKLYKLRKLWLFFLFFFFFTFTIFINSWGKLIRFYLFLNIYSMNDSICVINTLIDHFFFIIFNNNNDKYDKKIKVRFFFSFNFSFFSMFLHEEWNSTKICNKKILEKFYHNVVSNTEKWISLNLLTNHFYISIIVHRVLKPWS